MFPLRDAAKWFNNAHGFGFLGRTEIPGHLLPVEITPGKKRGKAEQSEVDPEKEREARRADKAQRRKRTN